MDTQDVLGPSSAKRRRTITKWKDINYYICSPCSKVLDVTCTFRNLCLQSNPGDSDLLKFGELNQECVCAFCMSSKAIHICEWCKSTFSTKLLLTDHILSHTFYTCNVCQKIFILKMELEQHILQTHISPVCDNNYNLEPLVQLPKQYPNNVVKAFSNYINSHPVSKNIKCSRRKRVKHKKYQEFVCEQCQTTYVSGKELINHSVKVHGLHPTTVKPFHCDECGTKFSSASNLHQHKLYHGGIRTYTCLYCGKGYITKNDLNTHEKQHLNKREYECRDCPKNFNTNKDLRSHRIVVHTNPNAWHYVCSFCTKRFPIKSNLDQHVRRHTGEKRFGCHFCEKRFVDKIVLQKHIKSHSNVRPFKCKHCERTYKDNKVLDVHLTKIHGIGNAKVPIRVKNYFCHICPKSYFAKNKLTRHIYTHTGEKPYVCRICDRKFTDKSYVKQHLRATHNIFETDEVSNFKD